jgi:acetyl-CoA C-acetyltransferase
MGQILTAGQGQNPARQASIAPASRWSPAWGVNQLCGSGLRAVALGCRQILNGDADIVVAGGQEVDEPGAALPASAQRREDGRLRDGRHHDQGRPVGRLQRLPHGQHRRERRQAVADHPRRAGRVRGRLAEQGRGRAEGRQVQGRDRAGHHQGPQGRRRGRPPTIYPPRRDARRASPSCARPSTRKAR